VPACTRLKKQLAVASSHPLPAAVHVIGIEPDTKMRGLEFKFLTVDLTPLSGKNPAAGGLASSVISKSL